MHNKKIMNFREFLDEGKINVSQSFKKYGLVNSDHCHGGDCIIRSISIAFGENLNDFIGEFRQKYKVRSPHLNMDDDRFRKFISDRFNVSIIQKFHWGKNVTIGDFLKENKKGEFFLVTHNHIAFAKNGNVYDDLFTAKKKIDKLEYTHRKTLLFSYEIKGNNRLK
jgi:hypothetical protein